MSARTVKSTKPVGSAGAAKAALKGKVDAAPVSGVNGSAPEPAKQQDPSVVEGPQPVILGPVMRKKELVDTVVAHSGMKKKDVKPVVESMLAVLGEALADNRELILPPFGRLKVRRAKALPNGRVIVAKIRQSDGNKKDDTAGNATAETDAE